MIRRISTHVARVQSQVDLTRLVDPTESVLACLPSQWQVAETSTSPTFSLAGPGEGAAGTLLASSVDFGAMLDFPPWTGRVFIYAGLCLFLLGLMAWLGSHQLHRRAWGRRLTLSGGGLFVVGTAWGTFVGVVRYVLG